MTAHALLFTLAAIGISETAYLIRKRRQNERPVCVLGEDCQKVLTSKYNSLLVWKNDEAGLLFYIVAALITALIVIGVGPVTLLKSLVEFLILASVLISLILLYLQWKVIRAWCFWCVMSAFTTFLMGIIVLFSGLRTI